MTHEFGLAFKTIYSPIHFIFFEHYEILSLPRMVLVISNLYNATVFCCCCFVLYVIFIETWHRLVIHPFKHLLGTICSFTYWHVLSIYSYCVFTSNSSMTDSVKYDELLPWVSSTAQLLRNCFLRVGQDVTELIELNRKRLTRRLPNGLFQCLFATDWTESSSNTKMYPSVCFFVCHWLNRTVI